MKRLILLCCLFTLLYSCSDKEEIINEGLVLNGEPTLFGASIDDDAWKIHERIYTEAAFIKIEPPSSRWNTSIAIKAKMCGGNWEGFINTYNKEDNHYDDKKSSIMLKSDDFTSKNTVIKAFYDFYGDRCTIIKNRKSEYYVWHYKSGDVSLWYKKPKFQKSIIIIDFSKKFD